MNLKFWQVVICSKLLLCEKENFWGCFPLKTCSPLNFCLTKVPKETRLFREAQESSWDVCSLSFRCVYWFLFRTIALFRSNFIFLLIQDILLLLNQNCFCLKFFLFLIEGFITVLINKFYFKIILIVYALSMRKWLNDFCYPCHLLLSTCHRIWDSKKISLYPVYLFECLLHENKEE